MPLTVDTVWGTELPPEVMPVRVPLAERNGTMPRRPFAPPPTVKVSLSAFHVIALNDECVAGVEPRQHLATGDHGDAAWPWRRR